MQGNKIYNSELTLDPPLSLSYAYCSDTIYQETITAQIKNVNMLYHEATFAQIHEARAAETFHTTSRQAASVAKIAGVGKLLIGHFSARYENLDILLNESREIFTETYLAEEGKTFSIGSA